MSTLHGSAEGILAPLEIVAEGPAGLDAPFAERFAVDRHLEGVAGGWLAQLARNAPVRHARASRSDVACNRIRPE